MNTRKSLKLPIVITVLVIIVIGIIFISLSKTRNTPVPKPDGEETGSFNKVSFAIGDYTINLNSAESGHPQQDSIVSVVHFLMLHGQFISFEI